jgi:hypothetical protein
MTKLGTIECWFQQQPFQIDIYENKLSVIKEYHFRLADNNLFPDAEEYYFIQNYDGNLELNKPAPDHIFREFLEELADTLERSLKKVQQLLPGKTIKSGDDYFHPGAPSAAA